MHGTLSERHLIGAASAARVRTLKRNSPTRCKPVGLFCMVRAVCYLTGTGTAMAAVADAGAAAAGALAAFAELALTAGWAG